MTRAPSDELPIPAALPRGGDVTGKRVVITGASRGLGRVLAHAFSQAGARVLLAARTEADLTAVAGELPGPTTSCAGDVTDPAFNDVIIETITAEWGGLDVWIGNAGVSPVVAPTAETEPEVWRHVIDVNLTANYLGARAAISALGPGGRIIFTGSVLGERPAKGLGAYSAAKAGLIGLAKSLALELAPSGVTVNVVAPGWFDSPLTEGWVANERLSARITDHTALRRWGRADDLAGAYQFLASDASSFVTGAVLAVDGGYLLV